MLLMSPDGQPADIDSEYWINYWKARGFRDATVEETQAYRKKKMALFEAHARAVENSYQHPSVYYQTVASGSDGYGMSRDIIKDELLQHEIVLDEQFHNQKIGLLYSYPNGITQFQNDVRLVMTMFESDKIPEDWPDYLKMADEVIVPSKWCHDVFLKSGVETTVVPLGYNDRIFNYIERKIPVEHDEPFTFIHYNTFNMRKGFAEVFEAFNKEFKTNEPVKLILKTTDRRAPIPIFPQEYPNIEVITGTVSEQELANIIGRANCMVYPSRGEGFGITPLEAMATGIPAIVPNAHGISEYFNSKYMLEVKADERCPGLYVRFKGQDVGEMVVCDVDDLRKQMRYAYNHQKEMHDLGKAASEYVKKFTYRETANKLAEIIKKWQNAEVVKRVDGKYLQVEKI